MALQVWLPLTKDLRNQGLNGVAVSNSGATYSATGGKLGGCYSFDGVDDRIYANNVSINNSAMSACCWVKLNNLTSSDYPYIFALGSNTSGTGIQIGLAVWKSDSKIHLVGNGSEPSSGYTPPTNTWIHLCITINGVTTKLYVNGVLTNTQTNANSPKTQTCLCLGARPNSTSGAGTAFSYPISGYINDFRLYDHCLSPMEVKEISKGLVLHYPLNRQGWGQENLLSRYVVPGQAAPTSTAAGGRTTWLGDYKITIPATENADTYFRLFTTKQLTANATYTISCKVSGLLSGTYYNFPLYAQNNTSMGVLQLNHNGLCSLTFTMTYGTQTAATGASGETVYICFMDDSARSIASGQGAITVSDFKLEEGSIATPWCPNSSDTLATTMGLNSTTEYDCSGFCNNLNKNGTYSYTSDTVKYSVATTFNGTEWMNGVTPGAEILTLACWAKTSKNKSTSQFMVADSTSGMCISFYSGCIIGYFGANGSQGTGSRCTLGSAYKENDWNHFVVVKTGTGTRTVYCNGVEQTPTSNDWWGSASGFFIGSRSNSASLPFYGQICDVRAYATALSADDVKSLYQNCATIGSDGTIYGQIRS